MMRKQEISGRMRRIPAFALLAALSGTGLWGMSGVAAAQQTAGQDPGAQSTPTSAQANTPKPAINRTRTAGHEDELFDAAYWQPTLSLLAEARKQELALKTTPVGKEADALRAKTIELYKQAAFYADQFAAHKTENVSGKIFAIRNGGEHGTVFNRRDVYYPNMAAAYAYFKAGHLSITEADKSDNFQQASRYIPDANNLGSRLNYLYGADVFQRIRLLGLLDHFHRSGASSAARPSEKNTDLPALLKELDLLLEKEQQKPSELLQQQVDMQNRLYTILSSRSFGGEIDLGPENADPQAIPEFIQTVDEELKAAIKLPGIKVVSATNTRSFLEVINPFPQLVQWVGIPSGQPQVGQISVEALEQKPTDIHVIVQNPAAYRDLEHVVAQLHGEVSPAQAITIAARPTTPTPPGAAELTLKEAIIKSGDAVHLTLHNLTPASSLAYEARNLLTGVVFTESNVELNDHKDGFDLNKFKELRGRYQLTSARVLDAKGNTILTLTGPDTFVIPAEAAHGLAFICAIDNYPSAPFDWFVLGAGELAQKLNIMGYKEDHIIRIYGTRKGGIKILPAWFEDRMHELYSKDDFLDTHGNKRELLDVKLCNDAFELFRKLVKDDVEPVDHVVLYYGGHGSGYKSSGDKKSEAFLFPSLGQDERLEINTWPRYLLADDSRIDVIGFFDACRTLSDSASPGGQFTFSSNPNATPAEEKKLAERCAVFQACKSGETAFIDDSDHKYGISHSFFAQVLLQSIDPTRASGNVSTGMLHKFMATALDILTSDARQVEQNLSRANKHDEQVKQHLPDLVGSSNLPPWWVPQKASQK